MFMVFLPASDLYSGKYNAFHHLISFEKHKGGTCFSHEILFHLLLSTGKV